VGKSERLMMDLSPNKTGVPRKVSYDVERQVASDYGVSERLLKTSSSKSSEFTRTSCTTSRSLKRLDINWLYQGPLIAGPPACPLIAQPDMARASSSTPS